MWQSRSQGKTETRDSGDHDDDDGNVDDNVDDNVDGNGDGNVDINCKIMWTAHFELKPTTYFLNL